MLALIVTALVVIALASDLAVPRLREQWQKRRSRRDGTPTPYDPGREHRAEQRARSLLRSCVGEEEWAMYQELGFIRVWGTGERGLEERRNRRQLPFDRGQASGIAYGYLIYAHKPIVSYVAQTNRLLAEYCVAFPDETRPYGSTRLPDSDDVLAKWMALTGDEQRLIESSNMHLPGRQVNTAEVKRDLRRLAQWESARIRAAGRDTTPAVSS